MSVAKGALRSRLVALVAAVSILGCASGRARIEVARDAPPQPWSHLEVNDDPEHFRFVLVGDRTGGHRRGVFDDAVDRINLLQPAFVLSVGDLIEGYSEDHALLDAQWAEFDAFVERLEMPFFYVAGNHDYSNPVMAHDWQRRLGPSYYHFRYRDVLFLVLNSEIFSSVADPGSPVEGPDTPGAQLAFVERVLEAERDARWTIVVLHQPLWDPPGRRPHWERVEELLGERPYTVFAGHFHRYTQQRRRGRNYITLATTGGTSRLRGIDRGEFDHVALVTMSADGPVIANLMLDGIHDDRVRSAATRARVADLDRAVTIEAMRSEGPNFRRGVQEFTLRNVSDQAITARARFDRGPQLRAEPPRIEQTLEPGESERVSVDLFAEPPALASELVPMLARWSVETAGERAPIRVEHHAFLAPDPVFPIAEARGPLRVDGELDDWAPLAFALEDWPLADGGRASAGLRFDLRYDAGFLYVAVDVRDPTPFSSRERSVREQDAVVVELDARPDPERSRNEGFRRAIDSGTLESLLIAWLAPVEPAPDPSLTSFLPPEPEGLRRAVRPVPGGYRAELAVPRAFLDARAGGPWRELRLNVALQDFGEGSTPSRTHFWRPSRFGTSSLGIEGSGTFRRR